MRTIGFYLASMMLISNLSADILSNCQNLLGSWEGSYTYPSNGVTNKYKITFNDDHTSSEVITLKAPNNSLMNHQQKGTWTCDGNKFTITVLAQTGDKVSNQYQFLEMTTNQQRFQHYFKDVLGPIFDLKRIK